MPRLLLIEGLPKYEGINEAKALAMALRLMIKGYDGRTAKSLNIIKHYCRQIRALKENVNFYFQLLSRWVCF